jgi:hypothetical protein
MATNTVHSPRSKLPFEVYGEHSRQGPVHIADHDGHVATFEYAEDAAYAMRACNSYPDLVAALKGVIRVADRATDEFDAARAALAKAEEQA